MSDAPTGDPLQLDPAILAFHQVFTFAPAPLTMTEALERSPLFRVEYVDRAARAEWMQLGPESDPGLFPLGAVTLHTSGVLLEAFGDRHMSDLRRCINGLQSFRVTADELRIVPVSEMIERPQSLMAPIADSEDRDLEGRDTATLYLRMAWPFLTRLDLGGRAPHALVQTGRGRREIESILAGLPAEFVAEFPAFPRFELDELREILLPPPAPAADAPTGEPASRRTHSSP